MLDSLGYLQQGECGVTRDVTWRPIQRASAKKQKSRRTLLALAVLLATNLAVVLYYGDPRDQLVDDTIVETKVDVEADAEGQSKTTEKSATLSAVVELDGVDGFSRTWDATAGMRTPARVQRVAVVGLSKGQTVADAVVATGAQGAAALDALGSLSEVVEFRRLLPGTTLKARFDLADQLISLDIHSGALDRFRAERDSSGWHGAKLKVEVDQVLSQVRGEVESSLWNALMASGEGPKLVSEIVDIFGWDIDFYREVFPGDTFRLLVEKNYVEGDFVGYGSVHAAEFITDGTPHRAYRFARADGGVAYYDEDGQSMRKQLLKSPLEYGRMTSSFGNRKHPVLGYSRAHNGVDYGVPKGTPVWTVGDGRVIRAGWNNGFGNVIEVRHANDWVSQYGHLSQIGVKQGQRVFQKDVIGKVGSTGLSTGPHLHYGLKKNGKYVNPASQKFERGKSLAGDELKQYMREVETLRGQIEKISVVFSDIETVEHSG